MCPKSCARPRRKSAGGIRTCSRGQWNEAVRRCRLVLDSIDRVLSLEKERVLQAFVSTRKIMTKHDRA